MSTLKCFAGCIGILGLAGASLAQVGTNCLGTFTNGGNGGNNGGMVYFDLDIGPNALTFTDIFVNSFAVGGDDVELLVYTTAVGGTFFGNEANPAAWTQVAIGTGLATGECAVTLVTLDAPFVLGANTTQGVAIELFHFGLAIEGWSYTNGNGANEVYSNADLRLTAGSASNFPFLAPTFNPRVFNGWLYYDGGTAGCTPPPQNPPPPPPLTACSLESLFANNNLGNVDGIIYMDVAVGAEALTIEGLDVNTSLCLGGAFQIEMWTRPVTWVGGELSPGQWTLQATGDGIGRGAGEHSRVVFPTPPVFAANDTFGLAFVGVGTQHLYTNGTGANQAYSDGFLSLSMGAAQNFPWLAPTFNPRVWNGAFFYTCPGACPCACAFDPDPACDIFDFIAFQNLFLGADPCACGIDPDPACDIFDFIAFQNEFLGGC